MWPCALAAFASGSFLLLATAANSLVTPFLPLPVRLSSAWPHLRHCYACCTMNVCTLCSQLNPSQRAELRAATERFGAQALELARLDRLKLTRRGLRGGMSRPASRESIAELSMSRATSAPHLLYNQRPTSVHGPKRGSSAFIHAPASPGFPQPIYDAWQRGIAIPGMPPPPAQLSPERKRELHERRRVRAKRMVEVWRQTQLEVGAKWVDKTRWYSQGDVPPLWFKKRSAIGHTCQMASRPLFGT